MPDPAAVSVETLIAVIGAIGVPSLGGLAWLVRTLGQLRGGQEGLKAAVDAFGVKLDGLQADQEKAREARGGIRATLADHDKRLTITQHDVERWLAGTYQPTATPGGRV